MATAKETFLQACKDVVAAHDSGHWSNSEDWLLGYRSVDSLIEYEKTLSGCDECSNMKTLRKRFTDAMYGGKTCSIPGASRAIENLRAAIESVEGN